MGAGASSISEDKTNYGVALENLRQEVSSFREVHNNPESATSEKSSSAEDISTRADQINYKSFDTPRGVTAKNEVIRLREFIRNNAKLFFSEELDESDCKKQEQESLSKNKANKDVLSPCEGREEHDQTKNSSQVSNNNDDEEDSPLRSTCAFCERSFSSERIEKHQKVCQASKMLQKVEGSPCELSNPISFCENPATETLDASVPRSEFSSFGIEKNEDCPKKVAIKRNWREERKLMKEQLRRDRMARLKSCSAKSVPEEETE